MNLKRKCPICSRDLKGGTRSIYSGKIEFFCKTKKHLVIITEKEFLIQYNEYEFLSSKVLNNACLLKGGVLIIEINNYTECNYIQEFKQLINKSEKLNLFK